MDLSGFRRYLWKAICYVASLIPGLLVIGGLVYVYVILQWDLVAHSGAYWTLVVCTVAFSSWCSLLESALMTINAEQFVLSFQAKATQLARQLGPKKGENPSAVYIKARHALDAEVILVSEASERNAPIVVVNHLSTVLLVALLPISLVANLKHDVIVDACPHLQWLGFAHCPFSFPGTGSESLTFFTFSLLLIIFGKIVPEKIGRKRNAWIICKCRASIDTMSVVAGWLVKPMLAIGDLFLLVF